MTVRLHDRVLWDVTDGIARITLADGRVNALNLAMAEGIQEAVQRVVEGAADRSVRVVVLAAEGPTFSVGGDLREFASADDRGAKVREVAGILHLAIRTLTETPVPVVSVIQGTVAGGGVGIALAADVVLMAEDAVLQLSYTAGGLTPDCGATWFLPQRIGIARALDLALTNRPLTGAEAAGWGLISRAIAQEDLRTVVEDVVAGLAAGPVNAYAETKRLLRSAHARTLQEQLDEESDTIGVLITEPDGIEGIDAFLAKRQPSFG